MQVRDEKMSSIEIQFFPKDMEKTLSSKYLIWIYLALSLVFVERGLVIFQRQEVALFSFVYNMIHYHIQLFFYYSSFHYITGKGAKGI